MLLVLDTYKTVIFSYLNIHVCVCVCYVHIYVSLKFKRIYLLYYISAVGYFCSEDQHSIFKMKCMHKIQVKKLREAKSNVYVRIWINHLLSSEVNLLAADADLFGNFSCFADQCIYSAKILVSLFKCISFILVIYERIIMPDDDVFFFHEQ